MPHMNNSDLEKPFLSGFLTGIMTINLCEWEGATSSYARCGTTHSI